MWRNSGWHAAGAEAVGWMSSKMPKVSHVPAEVLNERWAEGEVRVKLPRVRGRSGRVWVCGL